MKELKCWIGFNQKEYISKGAYKMKFNKLQIAIVSISIFFFVFNPKASAEEKNKLRAAQNGKLVVRNQGEYKSISADGVYGANYSIGAVSDEYRELHDFRLFENGILLFSIREVPGSDVEISNSGNVVFYDHSEHYKSLLKIHFYSKTGENVPYFGDCGFLKILEKLNLI